MTRILLVDDHAVVRTGYRRLIDAEPDLRVVGEADSGEAAYTLLGRLAVDVTVLDLSLPGRSGLETLRRILQRDAQARVLVFSMHGNPTLVMQVMRAGARGYVTKNCEPATMIHALREVAQGREFVSEDVARTLGVNAIPGGESPLAVLSAREFEIFRLLVDGQPVAQVAQRLNLSGKTIANYQTQIRQKLGVASDIEMLRLAIRYGLADLEPKPPTDGR